MDVRVAQDEDLGWHVVVVEMDSTEAEEFAELLSESKAIYAPSRLANLKLASQLMQAAVNARGGVTGPVE